MGQTFSELNCGGQNSREEAYSKTDRKKAGKEKTTTVNVKNVRKGSKRNPKPSIDKNRKTKPGKSKPKGDNGAKPYEFARQVKKTLVTETNSTDSKNTLGHETELKQLVDSREDSVSDLNHSGLEKDAAPSFNSEQSHTSLNPGNVSEIADTEHDEKFKRDKKKSKQEGSNETKYSDDTESNDDSDDADADDDDDDDDESDSDNDNGGGGGNFNFEHVGNMIIGTGKIIDRRTVTRKIHAKANSKGKSGDGKRKTKRGVNAEQVDNLGFGTVMILDERKIHTEDNVEENKKQCKPAVTDYQQPVPEIPVYAMKAISSVASSVGMIYGYNITGTVFRVGSNKIMTAWHVVRSIVYENSVSNEVNFERLAHPGVFVNFEFEEDHHQINSSGFLLEPKVLYYNEKLDIAVLQLKNNDSGKRHPRPFTKFDEFTRERHEKYPIYLIGHTESKTKRVDCVLRYWEPLEHRVKELTDWSEEEFNLKHGFGYTGIGKENRLHFQCSFRHGASGCPGLLVHSAEEVSVVTVLLRGFPDFYYYDNFTEEERKRVPIEKLIQQGSNMKTIMDDMKSSNSALYEEIFLYKQREKSIKSSSRKKGLKLELNSGSSDFTNPAESKSRVLCTPEVTSSQNDEILPSSQVESHPIAKGKPIGVRKANTTEEAEVQNNKGLHPPENDNCSTTKAINSDSLKNFKPTDNTSSKGEGTSVGCTSDKAEPSVSSCQQADVATVPASNDECSSSTPPNNERCEVNISTSNSQSSESRHINSSKPAKENRIW